MQTRAVRSTAVVLLPVAAGLVVFLALRERDLERRYMDLLERSLHPHPGVFVPAFEARSLRAGRSVTIGDPPAGKRDLLFFFTTGCPYSRASLPALREIAERAGAHARVVGVALDPVAAARSFAEAHALPYPVISLLDRRVASLYRVRQVPLVMVIDSAGRVLYARRGPLESASAVDSVLTAASARAAASATASPMPATRTAVAPTGTSVPGGEP